MSLTTPFLNLDVAFRVQHKIYKSSTRVMAKNADGKAHKVSDRQASVVFKRIKLSPTPNFQAALIMPNHNHLSAKLY